jgi:hypothetical protein
VLASTIVGADDTHLKALDKSRRNGTFRGHIWCFVGTDGTVNGPGEVSILAFLRKPDPESCARN